MIKLYNSLTDKIEVFKPIKEGEVSCYVCGPTVYNYVHVGNLRPVVVFDVLRRLFIHLGYKVKFISNFTDIDDKIIKQAKIEGLSEAEIASKYIMTDALLKMRNITKPRYMKLLIHHICYVPTH